MFIMKNINDLDRMRVDQEYNRIKESQFLDLMAKAGQAKSKIWVEWSDLKLGSYRLFDMHVIMPIWIELLGEVGVSTEFRKYISCQVSFNPSIYFMFTCLFLSFLFPLRTTYVHSIECPRVLRAWYCHYPLTVSWVFVYTIWKIFWSFDWILGYQDYVVLGTNVYIFPICFCPFSR